MEIKYDEVALKKELLTDAKGLGIPSGAAEAFTDRTLKATKKALKGKQFITTNDLKRTVAKELQKYNADFAYVYKNRDKII